MAPSTLEAEPALNNLVDAALRRSPYFARRTVRVETESGRVVLRGTVGSYYHKQMAQEILRRVDGVDRIDNHLEVDWA